MQLALEEAAAALTHDDVPVGAVVVKAGEVIASAHNERELRQDPTAHAEVIALREAAKKLGSWRVLEGTLYVTLEPCTMCLGASSLARLDRLVFGASDPKTGVCGGKVDISESAAFNHQLEVVSGVLAKQSSELLKAFFAQRR